MILPDGAMAYRNRLPHFQRAECWYHVTFSLRREIHLADFEIADVISASRFFDGTRWHIAALAVLPVMGSHCLCFPLEDPGTGGKPFLLHETVGRVKSFSARQINERRGRQGRLWEHESYDRRIWSARDFWCVFDYIATNPIKHGFARTREQVRGVYLNSAYLAGGGEARCSSGGGGAAGIGG